MLPIKAGSRIRNRRRPDVMGTFGCLVRGRDDPARIYVLGAAHVMGLNGYAEQGDPIEAEEAPVGSGRWVKIAEYERAYPWRDAPNVFQVCDAALARVTDLSAVSPEIEDIGVFGDVATGLYEGMKLKFRGAGTGHVETAQVYSYGMGVKTINQDFHTGDTFILEYARQILYVRADTDLVSPTAPEDSGALVLNADDFPVGLHFARTPDDYPVKASVCTPLLTVLDALQVDLYRPAAGSTATAAAPAPARPDLDTVGISGRDVFDIMLRGLLAPHSRFQGVTWHLSADGLIVDNKLERTPGALVTVPKVWNDYSALILQAAKEFRVPVELIVATICTESGGRPNAERIEQAAEDGTDPLKISVGLMQTLIRTARDALNDPTIDRKRLFDPATSINAGTAYIASQRLATQFDPPLVACAYNAGGIYMNDSSANRWRMRQYPIGGGDHADHFVQWFNDCFHYFVENRALLPTQPVSFVQLFRP